MYKTNQASNSGSQEFQAHNANNVTSGKKKPRLLGSVRPISHSKSVPKFPPLNPSLDSNYVGIHGNAMAIPPTKDPMETVIVLKEVKPSQTVSPVRKSMSMSSRSDTSKRSGSPEKKELKEAMVREKELKQQIMSLQKVIDELKVQIKEKDQIISDIQLQLKKQEEHYKELFQKEQDSHQETKEELVYTKSELGERENRINQLVKQHDIAMAEQKNTMVKKMTEMELEKDKQIAEREQRLQKLKKQMADALQGNSWERQQQLDELTKELGRVQDEADNLKIKLRQMAKSGTKVSSCNNCEKTKNQLGQTQQTLNEKDTKIRELESLCSRYQKQSQENGQLNDNRKNKATIVPKR